jgi:hypothetical protein
VLGLSHLLRLAGRFFGKPGNADAVEVSSAVPLVCDWPGSHPCRDERGRFRKCPGVNWYLDELTAEAQRLGMYDDHS